MIKSILFAFLLIAWFASCKKAPEALKTQEAIVLQKACEYLWSQQDNDGGWHSAVHGLLKGGQAWTPYALDALSGIPDSIYKARNTQFKKGVKFIGDHVNEEGVLGVFDPDIMEYPNYSTAYALKVLVNHGREGDKSLVQKMIDYLVAQQYIEHRGINEDNIVYGSWGFGETGIELGTSGYLDISHTRRVLEALRASGLDNEEVYNKAGYFIRLVQKRPDDPRFQPGTEILSDSSIYDGGFYYSPVVLAANKGKQEEESGVFRSYATATCDGLLSLLATGKEESFGPVSEAIQWLHDHPKLERAEGIPPDDPDQWHLTMVYYHLAVRAEVYAKIGWPEGMKAKMFDILKAEQLENGSFINPDGARNKEDDPILATSLAIIAMKSIMYN